MESASRTHAAHPPHEPRDPLRRRRVQWMLCSVHARAVTARWAAIGLLALGACSSTSSSGSGSSTSSTAAKATTTSTTAAVSPPTTVPAPATLSVDGFGALRFGMTPATAGSAVGHPHHLLRWAELPKPTAIPASRPGVVLFFVDGHLAVVELTQPTRETTARISIGSTEGRSTPPTDHLTSPPLLLRTRCSRPPRVPAHDLASAAVPDRPHGQRRQGGRHQRRRADRPASTTSAPDRTDSSALDCGRLRRRTDVTNLAGLETGGWLALLAEGDRGFAVRAVIAEVGDAVRWARAPAGHRRIPPSETLSIVSVRCRCDRSGRHAIRARGDTSKANSAALGVVHNVGALGRIGGVDLDELAYRGRDLGAAGGIAARRFRAAIAGCPQRQRRNEDHPTCRHLGSIPWWRYRHWIAGDSSAGWTDVTNLAWEATSRS